MIDRAFRINNTKDGFQNDFSDLTVTLKRNSFPVIDNIVKHYLNKNSNTNGSGNALSQNNSISFRYFNLPYIGNFSKLADINIKTLYKNFCSDFKIKLVFSFFKIKKKIHFKRPYSRWNSLVQEVTPVILVSLLAIFQ